MKTKLVAVAAVAVLLTGCLGSFFPGGKTATVEVYMTGTGTDPEGSVESLSAMAFESAQFKDEIKEVWVTITEVQARRNDTWENMFNVPEGEGQINLMNLRFREELLGQGTIPAGNYTELRFQLRENGPDEEDWHNYVVLGDGSKVPLKIPSKELKPQMNITVVEGTIDEWAFDVNHKYCTELGYGDYNCNPRQMLRFMHRHEYGQISASIELPSELVDWLSVEVQLFRTEETEPFWSTILEDGELELSLTSLPPGEYRLDATVQLVDTLTIELSSGLFTIEPGLKEPIVIRPLP